MADETTTTATEPASAEPKDGGITVEIEKPQGKPPIPDAELEKLTGGSDDDIARANEEAKKQVKGLRVAYQEQRRKAEGASRNAETATTLAEQLYRENQELRQNITRSESALIDQALRRAESQLEHSRTMSKQALQAGDADLIVASNEDMARAAGEVDRLKLLKPAAAAQADREAQAAAAEPAAPRPPAPAPPSARTATWVAAHPWFGYDPAQGHDVEMTKFAMRQHTHMAVDGITEESNPDLYWRTIEDKLRETYPDRFRAQPNEARARPVAATGSTRSNGAPPSAGGRRTVRLTESEVSLARRLGLTPEQYAADKVKYEQEQERDNKRSVQ
jgi:hypothetical protein